MTQKQQQERIYLYGTISNELMYHQSMVFQIHLQNIKLVSDTVKIDGVVSSDTDYGEQSQ